MFERDIADKKVEPDVSHQKVQIVSFSKFYFHLKWKKIIKRSTALSKGKEKMKKNAENSCLHLSIKL